MNKKKIQADKHKKMMSLTLYLQNQAAEKADKLLFRQEKRRAKLEAAKGKKEEHDHEGHDHDHHDHEGHTHEH